MGEISNSIAIWLGISPPDLFFYAFLPPLLVDSAIRIEFFMFSKAGWAGQICMHACRGRAVALQGGIPLAIRAELPACPFALLCSQLWVHILMMAFVMVILSALILTPRTRLPACLPACLFICLLACLLAAALASIITFQSHCHPCLPHCHL